MRDWEQALYSVIPKRKFQQGEKEEVVQVVDAAAAEANAEYSPDCEAESLMPIGSMDTAVFVTPP